MSRDSCERCPELRHPLRHHLTRVNALVSAVFGGGRGARIGRLSLVCHHSAAWVSPRCIPGPASSSRSTTSAMSSSTQNATLGSTANAAGSRRRVTISPLTIEDRAASGAPGALRSAHWLQAERPVRADSDPPPGVAARRRAARPREASGCPPGGRRQAAPGPRGPRPGAHRPRTPRGGASRVDRAREGPSHQCDTHARRARPAAPGTEPPRRDRQGQERGPFPPRLHRGIGERAGGVAGGPRRRTRPRGDGRSSWRPTRSAVEAPSVSRRHWTTTLVSEASAPPRSPTRS